MPDVIKFDAGTSLKVRFRAAKAIDVDALLKAAIKRPVELDKPKTSGHALYLVYRTERTRQNFEEWKWESLDVGQRLVWERTAEVIGLKIPV